MIDAILVLGFFASLGLACLLFVWGYCTVANRAQRRRVRKHADRRPGPLPQDTFWRIVEANWPPPSSDWLADENRRRAEAGDVPLSIPEEDS